MIQTDFKITEDRSQGKYIVWDDEDKASLQVFIFRDTATEDSPHSKANAMRLAGEYCEELVQLRKARKL